MVKRCIYSVNNIKRHPTPVIGSLRLITPEPALPLTAVSGRILALLRGYTSYILLSVLYALVTS